MKFSLKPLWVALRGKGLVNLTQRAVSIVRTYGWGATRMEHALDQFAALLQEFECRATFPIVATVLARHPQMIRRYHAQGIEFAIHGYRHIDHCQLDAATQTQQLAQAVTVFAQAGMPARGFRGPYLHANAATLTALRHNGLAYDASPGLYWDVLEGLETEAYRYVLNFYGALPASDYPSVPALSDGLVRIPYSLPDDEALAQRLALRDDVQKSALWLRILERTYALGELFAIGLHPERIAPCAAPLRATLAEARRRQPAVWLARLDEIAAWWQARSAATLRLEARAAGEYGAIVEGGPSGATVLARGCEIAAPTHPWYGDYVRVASAAFTLRAPYRPVIGLAAEADPALGAFLRQQGYGVETSAQPQACAYHFTEREFPATRQRALLEQIEAGGRALVRLGRWPDGARSALSVTGDIDALALGDYLARFGSK